MRVKCGRRAQDHLDGWNSLSNDVGDIDLGVLHAHKRTNTHSRTHNAHTHTHTHTHTHPREPLTCMQ